MGEGDDTFTGHKAHRKPQKGKKFDKKKGDKKGQDNVDPKIRNPKAFAINSAVRAERKFRRAQDHETKKDRVPLVDRTPVEAPPFVVAVVGPPKVGKSTLLTNLIKNYTRQNLTEIKGPVTIVTGKKRRLTFIEANNDIHSLIDVAKVADLALLLVDASFGFEMEVFEFLNICQVHGFPQIMGVLTHLDRFKNKKKLKKTKKTLKHRFWTEVYPGSKLFYLSGYFPMTNSYPKNEVHNLARFISVMKFRQTLWRSEHAYVVADRMEDLTSLESVRVNPKVDRKVSLYGWVHGTYLKQHVSVHIPGLGDFTPDSISALPDPCPLPLKERVLRRSLNEKEKVMYAPFSGVGGIVYDQDAVYIDLGGRVINKESKEQEQGPATTLVEELRDLKATLDEKMDSAGLQFFSNSEVITGAEAQELEGIDNGDSEDELSEDEDGESKNLTSRKFTPITEVDGRVRRKVVFDDEDEDDIQMSKEIEELKKLQDTNVAGNDEEDGDESEEDEESDDDNDEGKSEEEAEKTKNRQSKTVQHAAVKKPQGDNEDDSIHSIVSKLKKKLQNESGPAPAKSNSNKEPEVEFDQEDDVGSSSDDDNDDVQNIASDSEEEINDDDGDMDDSEESEGEQDKAMDTSDSPIDHEEKCLKYEKKKRYSLAETAFYSRFQNRSVQKMIYDDEDEYLNVNSKADFDQANCPQLPSLQEEDQDDNADLKDLFIGGDYAETAKNILDADDELQSDEDDMFGDFEELDEQDGSEEKKGKQQPKPKESEESSQKKREDMKKKLKEKFDMEYDDGEDDKSFYRDWKAQVEEQTKINRTFFDDVEDLSLLQDLRGLAPGTYVRVEISGIPCEFVVNFEPQRCCPIVLGSLDSPNQETLAVVQARVKKHRWHPKILKTRDPVIMSIGWRRFQTIALYSVQDHNMRNRMIKYTPDHQHCVANFYGPMTPQGTGILGIAPEGFSGFRITMTGTVLDMDKSTELVKKLKLVGTPAKIFKKSAFIEGMFSSQLEVAKFVGAKIKTVSGIRGVVKKELRTPVGAFRATFEDKIVPSDIVFCRTWAKVDIPSFYLNLPTMITSSVRVMKTLGQLKRERDIQVQPNPDHLYTPIERQEKQFKPLKIPKRLQDRLPYKEKPKVLAKLNEPKRIAVIRDPHERQMSQFLTTLKTRVSERESKEKAEKAKKSTERQKTLKKLEERKTYREKELRKKVFRTLGQLNKNNDGPGGGASSKFKRGGGSGGRGGRGGAARPHRHQRK